MKLWRIFRGTAFMGTVRASDAEQAVQASAQWAEMPVGEFRAEVAS